MQLNQEFRTLWEQHVAWTRMLIISIAEGLRDEKQVTDRLLRNADDMAAVLNRVPAFEEKRRAEQPPRSPVVRRLE